MSETIFCKKLQKDAPALTQAPYPGELGQKILKEISEPAWQMWIGHQTMVINENHLNLLDDEARKFLRDEMENFLFGDGSKKPEGYVPPTSTD